MPPVSCDPALAREFAMTVVARLRQAGHEALWAGGCVRDELLGRVPKDYDVATAALPDEVRAVFGRRRTLAVGAAFGVITVLGPRGAGQVEVATFRSDGGYTDGRHPAGVTFTDAREDAQRRDFTINGLFFDPLSGEVHDHVGGRADLAAGIVRAIGAPTLRFGEDHLRMLRAVRFAAVFGFVLEEETRAAVVNMAHLVTTVSPERIAAELRAMVERPGRRRALELLRETGLAREVLPELCGFESTDHAAWDRTAAIVDALDEPALPSFLAIACLDRPSDATDRLADRLRLSTRERKTAGWLRDAVAALDVNADELAARPWSAVQPWLAHADAFLLADLLRARAANDVGSSSGARWVTERLALPREILDPPPLVGGADLLGAGVAAGPALGRLLAGVRAEQLDGRVTTREAALDWVNRARTR